MYFNILFKFSRTKDFITNLKFNDLLNTEFFFFHRIFLNNFNLKFKFYYKRILYRYARIGCIDLNEIKFTDIIRDSSLALWV